MIDGMTLAESIRTARERASLTQDELARLSGVRQPNIAAYESGRRQPSAQMLQRLLDAAKPRPSQTLSAYRDDIVSSAKRHKASNVRVFGSVARGDDRSDSDLDLLVTFDDGASLFDQVDLTHELETLLQRSVDVVSDRALVDRHARLLEDATPL